MDTHKPTEQFLFITEYGNIDQNVQSHSADCDYSNG